MNRKGELCLTSTKDAWHYIRQVVLQPADHRTPPSFLLRHFIVYMC